MQINPFQSGTMFAGSKRPTIMRFGKTARVAAVALGAVGLSLSAAPANAYIGPSYLKIPDRPGQFRHEQFDRWIVARANVWPGRLRTINSGGFALAGNKLFFGGPNAAKPGNPGKLMISMRVADRDIGIMRNLCETKSVIPEMEYAESSWRARPVLELGPRPKDLPEFWRYRLKDAKVADCAHYEGAAEQMFLIAFSDIDWLNYDKNRPMANKIVVAPEDLPLVRPTGPGPRTKSYLITWIGLATHATVDQCAKMNVAPSDDDYFRFKTAEEKAKVWDRYQKQGLENSQLEQRAPLGHSVFEFPGAAPDPGLIEPNPTVALGVDLDGNDGQRKPPRSIRSHANFTAPDGRRGIDNELHRVLGCVLGYRGKGGYRNQTSNARRADGNIVTIIEVSDIDDEKNDSDVTVKIIHSLDTPIKDNAGKVFLANYTFSPTDDPNFALYNHQLKGRITNGVIETTPVASFLMNLGQDPEWNIHDARFRLTPNADGSVSGVLAGYRDWNKLLDILSSERSYHYSKPSVYYAFRRHADAWLNPSTGDYDGISSAYEIEAVPAFLVEGKTGNAPTAIAQAQQ